MHMRDEDMRKFTFSILTSLILLTNAYADLNITLSPATDAKSPQYIGVNLAHYLPDSNTTLFLQHLGVNSVRVWLDALGGLSLKSFVGSDWGKDLNCSLVTNETQFNAAVSALRKLPDPTSFIPSACKNYRYSTMVANFAKSQYPADDNRRVPAYIVSEMNWLNPLQANGMEILAELDKVFMSITLSTANTSSGWQDRWEFYKTFYLHTYFLSTSGIKLFELVNERDAQWVNAEFIDRYKISSRAIKDAFADRWPNIQPEVIAPATVKDAITNNPAGMTPIMQRHIKFPATTNDLNWSNISGYSWHKYWGECNPPSGYSYINALKQIRSTLNNNGASDLNIYLTEFNSNTSGNLDKLTTTTLDSPSEFSLFAHKAATSIGTGLAKGIYAFKFSQTQYTGDANSNVKKNGLHYVDNSSPPLSADNIGGTTNAAEAYALLAAHFAGGQSLLNVSSSATDKCIATVAVDHAAENHYDLYAVNNTNISIPVNVNVSKLSLLPNSVVIIHKVSSQFHGEVESVLPVSPTMSLNLEPYSIAMLTLEKNNGTAKKTSLLPTDDAYVKAGTNSDYTYGTLKKILIGTSNTSDHTTTSVGYLKFQLPTTSENIYAGILQLSIKFSGTSDGIFHIYGLTQKASASWQEGGSNPIKWNNAPHLSASPTSNLVVDNINKNFFNYFDPNYGDAVFIGSMYVPANTAGVTKLVDVTQFVKLNPNPTFVIIREFRMNPYGGAINYPGDNLTDSSVAFSSKEDTTGKPMLMLYTY